ncbi:MAG: hypothetical protein ACKO9Q_32540, partial [Pirellula sp.]
VKFIGGAYLVYIAVKHLFWDDAEEELVVMDKEGQPGLVDAFTGKELSDERLKSEIEQRIPIPSSLVTEDGVVNPPSGTPAEKAVCDVPSHSNWKFWKTVA